LLCWRSLAIVETSVAGVTPLAVAISRSASQNASSRLTLVLCPAMTVDLFKTRDFCIPPFMKHPHQAAQCVCGRYNRVIGETRNHLSVCRAGPARTVRLAERPYFSGIMRDCRASPVALWIPISTRFLSGTALSADPLLSRSESFEVMPCDFIFLRTARLTDNSGQGLSWAQRADSTGAFHIETW
jgi:hypothetical protein